MNSPSPLAPGVSVIIPSYESHATARATLQSLREQTYRNFEIILIDSSHTNDVANIVADFPEVRYQHTTQRLLPHEARNVGIGLARHDLLLFTDPDIVAAPDWIEKIVAAHRASSMPMAGAVASVQHNWLGLGVHFAKFDLWLPGGPPRTLPVAASVNFLCPRQLIDDAGGFDGREMIGDTLMSWELVRRGANLQFAPDAVVVHDHRSTFAQLLRERFVRGADFARLRAGRGNWDGLRTGMVFLATILPLRLLKLMGRTFSACARSGCVFDFIRTFPVVLAGHGAWLAGEAREYCRRLLSQDAPNEASGRARRNAGT
jgi:GT2 family glycosyltransferase